MKRGKTPEHLPSVLGSRRWPICEASGKVAYKRPAQAERDAAALVKHGAVGRLYIYRCRHCGLWHLTRSAKRRVAA